MGQPTVSALHKRGHSVRSLVRRSPPPGSGPPHEEVVLGDLRTADNLPELLVGVDAVVHLAALVSGSDEAMLAVAVGGTERLLRAMDQAGVRRLVLCSSFSVYNYRKIPVGGTLSEDSPLLEPPDLHLRNGYSIAKTQQENLVRDWAKEKGGALTVLRPGFIWGPNHEYQPFLGPKLGPVQVIFEPDRPVPLTYVDNCAEAFAVACEDPGAIGETFNVVDPEDITAQSYAETFFRRTDQSAVFLPIPYAWGFANAWLASRTKALLLNKRGRLPGLLVPHRFEPRFKPFRVAKHRLSDRVDYQPPVSYQEAIRKTYGGEG